LASCPTTSARPFVLPFLEGLITAAAAPVLATYLRNIEANSSTDGGAVVETQRAIDASADLAKQMQLAAKQLEAVSAAFGSLNGEIRAQTATFKEATGSAATAARDLLATLNGETTKLKGTLGDFQGDVKALAAAAREGRDALTELSVQVNKVTGTTGKTDEMLKALSRLIASVEHFIGRDKAAA
jgi:chromosome segregation ATPase